MESPLLACFPSLSVNGVFENLTNPQASSGQEQCLAVYNNLATLQRDAYLLMCKYIVPDKAKKTSECFVFFFPVNAFDVGVRLNISLEFRTNNCSGLLLFVASSIYTDHLLVKLRDGRVSAL